MDFCCPRCRGPLERTAQSWHCAACARSYPDTLGFTDLRLERDEADLAAATQLAHDESLSFEALLARAYEIRPAATPALEARHLAHLEAEFEQAETAFRLLQAPGGALLDVGCGPATYLAAASNHTPRIGLDNSLFQLVLARRRVGTAATLVAADALHLPFPDQVFAAVTAADVLEHLSGPGPAVAEMSRVLTPGGKLFASTPNRFSVTPEPHVGIWGLGYLPRESATRHVRRKLGVDYSDIRPLSLPALRSVLAEFHGEVEIRAPIPGPTEMATFSPGKRTLARIYRLIARSSLNALLKPFAPYFIAIGHKRHC